MAEMTEPRRIDERWTMNEREGKSAPLVVEKAALISEDNPSYG